MRTILLFFPIFCFHFQLIGQQNHDYIWVLGYSSTANHPDFGGTIIDFNFSPPDIFHQYTETNFREANASMCDGSGNLLFYSNGLSVTDHLHGTMENGTGLNPGEYADGMLDGGYHLWQGIISVPAPGQPDRYYLIHTPKEIATAELSWHSPVIYYTVIDMSANNGLGKVLEKNVPVVTDTLGQGQLTAVRHANGRDWWLLDHEFVSNSYYRILVDSQGVHNLGTASVGEALPKEGIGQSVFSPDGRFYARINSINTELGQYLDIYEFDRCSGLLESQLRINYNDTAYSAGVAISPNSRYLYVSSYKKIYQFDLLADDIAASKETVAVYDGFQDDGIGTRFYLAQLAPDGKIYINSPTGTRYLHVIHKPDLPSDSCMVEQHGVQLPRYNRFSIPNHPNYRLGPMAGSPCDTLGLSAPPVAMFTHGQDFPNPLWVTFTDQSQSMWPVTSWQWDFGDGTSSPHQNPLRKYTEPGLYEVCLTVSNPYGQDSTCQTVMVGTVGTEETLSGAAISVFPNPAKDLVTLEWLEGANPRTTLEAYVFDGTGRQVRSLELPAGQNTFSFETANLRAGVYWFEIRENGKPLFSEKLVLVK